jgi:hypothetical protein
MALSENEIRVDNVRLAFPRLAVPEAFEGGDDETRYFSAAFILPKDHPQLPALEKLMLNAAIAKWGPTKGPQTLKAAKAVGKVFLRDGDTKAGTDGFEGNMYISARTKESKPPQIRDGMRNIISKEADIEKLLYGGCYCNVIINVYAYNKGSNGVAAGLKTVQFRANGDAFVGGPPSEDDDLEEIAAPESDSLME